MKRFTALLLLLLLAVCAFVHADEEAALPLQGVKIGIDPGHQRVYDNTGEPVAPGSNVKKQRVAGGTSGCRSHVMEYEVNLDVGLILMTMLTEAGAEVYITHDTLDVNISNKERAEFFNEHEVDLGIRLHCNKAKNRKSRGAVMLVPDQKHTAFFDENCRAALTVLDHYCAVTGLPKHMKEGRLEIRDDQAGFNWCTRPIICIEMGYLSNEYDDALLSDPEFQILMAQGIFEGISAYFAESAAPAEPAAPAESAEPAASAEPAEPVAPAEPAEPAAPTESVEPAEPAAAAAPAEPAAPAA